MKIKSAVISLLVALSQADTSVPTQAPSVANETLAPSQSNAPTALTNSSAPSPAPSSVSNTTVSPSPTSVIFPTLFPTPAPSESNSTEPPSVAPTATETTVPPTASPTTSPPSASPSLVPDVPTKPHKSSIGKIIAKTIGWLILIALSVLGFGAAMSNRYQIYYALRGVWYTILQMECTRWIVTKLNLGGGGRVGRGTNSSLNEIIFDNNDLTEGLLMGDT